jgi:hypothetical protein
MQVGRWGPKWKVRHVQNARLRSLQHCRDEPGHPVRSAPRNGLLTRRRFPPPGPSKILYSPNWLIGVSPGDSGLDFFGGGPEYFKIIPLTWQDNEFIPVLMAKPAE